MKRREELVMQYLLQAGRNARQAAEALERDYRALPFPIKAEEMVAHLMAIDKLKELAERKEKGERV